MKRRTVAKHGFACALVAMSCAAGAHAEEIWQVTQGRTTLTLDLGRLAQSGITVEMVSGEASVALADGGSAAIFLFEAGTNLSFSVLEGTATAFLGGELLHQGGLTFSSAAGSVTLFDFAIAAGSSPESMAFEARESTLDAPALHIGLVKAGIDPRSEAFVLYGGEVRLSPTAARALGDKALAKTSIGVVMVEAVAQWIDGDAPSVPFEAEAIADAMDDEGTVRGGNPQTCEAGEEPDVIVGDLHEVARWGNVGGVTAYSVGTVSCNTGTCWLNWIQNTNQHPVIPQNMFRLKTVDGAARFEQIGQSWLKHGFFALSQGLCFSDCQSTDGSHLGIHCSDPYSAGLNAQQSNLGPRSQVNASTGAFPYPFSAPPPPATIGRRLQVNDTDLNSAQNPGALYFVEGHYVAADDTAAGNDNNNASYRRINIGASPNFNPTFVAGFPTRREKAGIRAWKEHGLGAGVPDPAVEERDVEVSGDGLYILAAKATDLGNGFHRYEYAIQNLNSHRSARSFTVPIPPGVQVQNAGFHDVNSHSGEPYDLTDWNITIGASTITWSTTAFDVNPNANALRWGTLYNFRFDANVAPVQNDVTLGLFRPGTPAEVSVQVVAPPLGPPDCNFNGIGDPTDIAMGTSQDCDSDNTPDECQLSGNDCNADSIPDNCQLAGNDCDANGVPDDCQADCNENGTADPCDISGGGSTDCDDNGVPDDCQADCDGNGTPDTCELGIVLFQDDFEADQGWTVSSDSPVSGVWERADPQQTVFNANVVQPEFDNPAGTGTMCLVTDGRGPVTSSYDVDSGPTRIISPTLDLSAGAATLNYAYWFHTVLDDPDTMIVEVSNDNGGSWVPMFTHAVSASVWRTNSILVDNFIARTATMKFRFVISDMDASYTEGLIDDVVVTTPNCPSTCETPAAVLTAACSNKSHNGAPCCLPISGTAPSESSEPRAGGISEIQLTFDRDLCSESFILGTGAVTIEETTSALYPTWQAWSGGAIMNSSGSGNTMTLTFSPALADRTTYRIHVSPSVSTVSGQSFDIRGLTGDVDNSGSTDAGDRSVVVGAWTGSGFTCATDVNLSGATDGGDRSVIVGVWTSGANTAP